MRLRGLSKRECTLTTTPLLSFNFEVFYRPLNFGIPYRFRTLTAPSPQRNMGPSTHPEPNATVTGNQNCFNQIHSNNTTTNITYADEKAKVLNWLSPLQPHARHNYVRARRQDGLGEWFLQTDEFLRWRDGEGESGRATLFCSGNPGVGKTFLR